MSTLASDSSPMNVAIAGPTGSLGRPIVATFLENTRGRPAVQLTLLTRDATKTQTLLVGITKEQPSLDTSNVIIKVVSDYGNASELKSALSGQDSLIILLNRSLLTEQVALIDAAIAANVKHIVPSSFGTGTHHPYIHSAPTLMEKVQMEDHLTGVINDQPSPASGVSKTTYTVVNTGLFLEHGMRLGVLVNLKSAFDDNEKSLVFDDGSAELATTSLADIGTATKNAIFLALSTDEKEREKVANKVMYAQTMSVTPNDMLGYAKTLVQDRKWDTVSLSSKALEEASQKAYDAGERNPNALRGSLVGGTFGRGTGKFEEVDNELLDVKQLHRDEIKEVVNGFLEELRPTQTAGW